MDELIPLSLATLTQMPKEVRLPRYARAALSAGIVHIGLGNFHRAHQAWYLHRLFDLGRDHDWAILGAGVRAPDAAMRDRLAAQDYLSTLIELGPDHSALEITGAMIGFVPVQPDNAALIAQMAAPEIRIVSMTVTEGGYFRTAAQGFDIDHPDIRHDAAHPGSPRTAFGAMIAALRLRRAAGHGPFTGLSCDNVQGNGDILRQTVVGLARLQDPGLADWIDAECSFPNSMVDSIAPATGPEELALIRRFGIADAAPVTHENFRQWVIEDDFCAGRPALEQVGVTLTDDVHGYEAMKLRLLNASHQIIANAGELLGVQTISGCMDDPQIAALLSKIQSDEMVPEVPDLPEITAHAYAAQVARRFANPAIVDTTRRVAFDGAARHMGFLHPILRDRLSRGAPVEGLALAEALWARMCAGRREDGSQIAPNDPAWDALHRAAQDGTWLAQTGIYGPLANDPGFADSFYHWQGLLDQQGVRATLRRYLEG